ncbi:hypothetical protein TCAL_17369 [Tigriopus californicus]|uniref:Uncharacterized protein n=1 Tax=Tigriopus californicus TaxID=6832 RepID=A0A553PD42_TIGCA|nr:hypothetical protein TCAL_17369 [Tigriopus californicus]
MALCLCLEYGGHAWVLCIPLGVSIASGTMISGDSTVNYVVALGLLLLMTLFLYAWAIIRARFDEMSLEEQKSSTQFCRSPMDSLYSVWAGSLPFPALFFSWAITPNWTMSSSASCRK